MGASAQPDSPELVIGSTCPNLVLTCAPHVGGPLPGQHGAILGTSSHSISPHSLQPSCLQNMSPVGAPIPSQRLQIPLPYMGPTDPSSAPDPYPPVPLPHLHTVASWPF